MRGLGGAHSRMSRTRLVDPERQPSTSEARLAQAKQMLDTETARYEDGVPGPARVWSFER